MFHVRGGYVRTRQLDLDGHIQHNPRDGLLEYVQVSG